MCNSHLVPVDMKFLKSQQVQRMDLLIVVEMLNHETFTHIIQHTVLQAVKCVFVGTSVKFFVNFCLIIMVSAFANVIEVLDILPVILFIGSVHKKLVAADLLFVHVC